MSNKPITVNDNCLNKYTSLLPLFILYAKEPVALYTTKTEISARINTIPQMNLSPCVRFNMASLFKEANEISFMLIESAKKNF